MPHWSQIVVGLLDEPYLLRIEEVSLLTIRQIYFLYYRERDKDGKAKPLPYLFADPEDKKKAKIEQFIAFGKQIGKTDEEIEQILKEAEKNGSI